MKKVRRFFEGDEVDTTDRGAAGTGETVKPEPKATPKPRIVTKEELAKSGLSLRDFLNKERGLTRRKEKDPTAGDSPDKAAQAAADAIDPGKTMGSGSIMDKSPEERAAMVKLGLQRQEADRAMKAFKAKKSTGMKSGGSVSSASVASRRGDGIAQRGKTRGKMC